MVERANTEAQFSLVAYGPSAETLIYLKKFENKKLIKKTFKKIKAKQRSKNADLVNALQHVRTTVFVTEKGDIKDNPNAIVVITDQTSKPLDRNDLQKELNALHLEGTKLFFIGVGSSQPSFENEEETQILKQATGEKYFYVAKDYSELLTSPDLPRKLGHAVRPFRECY